MVSAEFEKAAEQVVLCGVNTDLTGKQIHKKTY
jgi:hypothetical protein